MAKRRGFGQKLTFIGEGAIKAVNPWDLESDRGWTILSGGDDEKNDEAKYFASVPWLYRGVKDRANNVAHMPYSVLYNGEEYDTEADPGQNLEWFESVTTVWHKLEMSLCLVGRAYVKLDVNPSGYIKGCRYLVPTSITEVYYDKNDADEEHPAGTIKYFEHTVGGIKYKVPVDQIVAIYEPAWTTENGPGNSSAAKAALTSAGVLYHTDVFIAKYFQRGAIKASVLVTLGFTQNEADRLQHWWDDVVAGIKNAWAAVVLKGEAVKPTVIGEGLDSLQNETLTTERRQNIATALGVPESRMWSAAANYATRVQDDKAYFEGTIIPDCELLEEAWNEQVFTAEHHLDGFTLQFKPEALSVFQADASDQAAALKSYTDSGVPLLMAMDLVGIELSDKQRAELEQKAAEKPAPVPPQLPPGNQPLALPAPAQAEPVQAMNPDMQNALAMWQRKAIKRYKESGEASCEFVSDVISPEMNSQIVEALKGCKSVDDVKGIFSRLPEAIVWPAHEDDDTGVMDQIKRAMDWLEAHA